MASASNSKNNGSMICQFGNLSAQALTNDNWHYKKIIMSTVCYQHKRKGMCINHKYTHVTSQKTGIYTNIAGKHTCARARVCMHTQPHSHLQLYP